jgi:transketolase C-terminal domain/subunit
VAAPLDFSGETVEQAFLVHLCEFLKGEIEAGLDCEILWGLAEFPSTLNRLGQVTSLVPVENLLEQASRVADRGGFPIVCLSSRSLPELLKELCRGLDFPALLVTLHGGLNFSTRESILEPGRLRDLALLRTIPGLAVTSPADEHDALNLAQLAIQTHTTLALRFSSTAWVPVKRDYQSLSPGASLTLRVGSDITLLAAGSMLLPSLLAAEALVTWGYDASVVSARFVRPLDASLITSLLQTPTAGENSGEALPAKVPSGRVLLTVEEHCIQGGLHTAVLDALSARLSSLKQPIHDAIWPKIAGLGLPAHPPITVGSGLEQFRLDAEGIQKAALRLLGTTMPDWMSEQDI